MILQFLKTMTDTTDTTVTVKYIFKTADHLIIEFSYINKNDGKDIICLPSQSMCNLGCKFCHTCDYIGKIKCRNLLATELIDGVTYVCQDQHVAKNNRVLLVSFMGCGEPILNVNEVLDTMERLQTQQQKGELIVPYIRFAIATSIPRYKWEEFFTLVHGIHDRNLPVKLHLSLHYTIDVLRREWMPASLDIIPSLTAVDFYKKMTGNNVEIHYTLIEGVNDTEQDAILLSTFLKDKDINVKFLFYNERPAISAHASKKDKLDIFKRYFDKYNIKHEYYIPPGLSIGASCGAFLMDYYLEHNGEMLEKSKIV
jgi:23S rRNA (adenine2503-C2)-methyltransferase